MVKLSTFMKYQMRTRAFLAPGIFVFFTIYHFIIPGADFTRMGIFFLQALFYDNIRRNGLNLNLVQTAGFPLSRLLWLQNISWFIWFNVWFILAQLIVTVWGHSSIEALLLKILRFEIVLLVSTIVGNIIANSDYVTIRSKFWQYTSAAFVFSMVYLITVLSLKILWGLTHSFMLLVFLIAVLTAIWYWEVRSEKKIRFFKYMIN